jgi:hypothetical protein
MSSGAHHLDGGAPKRASQRRRQDKAKPRPLYREGMPVTFQGRPAVFVAHDGDDHAVIALNDRRFRGGVRWRVPIDKLR